MADPLLKAFAAADEQAVVKWLHGMPEAERRAHAERLNALRRESRSRLLQYGRLRGLRFADYEDDDGRERANAQHRALHLAVFGTASLTELKALHKDNVWISATPELTVEVLLDRRPAWLEGWAGWMFDEGSWMWPVIRGLVRAEAIERPARYYERMVTAAARALDDDPELLDHDVWVMLREQAAALRQADHSWSGWKLRVTKCVADGRMDRARVLDLILDALAADLEAYAAGWFTNLWKELAVTPAERAARTPGLQALLGAATPQIVGFAVEELTRTDAAVPPDQLAPALAVPTKTTVLAALKLLDRAPDAATATVALGHEKADVQAAALDRLGRWPLDDAARAALSRHLDVLAATQRSRAEALLGVANLKVPGTVYVDVEHIPEHIREALNFGGPVPPVLVPGEPVLGEPVAPIETFEALVDELLIHFTVGGEVDEERLLAGISRFCDRDVEGRLRTRLEPWADRAKTSWWDLAGVAAVWAFRAAEPGRPTSTWTRRMEEVGLRAARGDARPLLAEPTHAGGWIDPLMLLERLRPDPDEYDLAQALLRLAPDHREAALTQAADVPGRVGALVRCALGGDPVEPDGPAAHAALAACDAVAISIRIEDGLDITLSISGGRLEHSAVTEVLDHDQLPNPSYLRPEAWPGRRGIGAPYLIRGVVESYDSPHRRPVAHRLLRTVLPPTEPLSGVVLSVAMLALGSPFEEEHLLAVDVLIAGIEDGRIDALPSPNVGLIKPNRLAARLKVVAAAGPLHAAVVRTFLDLAIDRVPERPGPLLTLFDELCAQTGAGPDHAREHLATLKQKTARTLLKREGDPSEHEAQLVLAARVRRAQRWIG